MLEDKVNSEIACHSKNDGNKARKKSLLLCEMFSILSCREKYFYFIFKIYESVTGQICNFLKYFL